MWNGAPRLEDLVRAGERVRERLCLDEGAVARRVHVREVEDRAHPPGAARDLEYVVERPEVAHAAHDLDAEGHGAVLRLEALAERPELLDDRVERILPRALEQEAGVEDHDLGAARGRDPRAPVEGADR